MAHKEQNMKSTRVRDLLPWLLAAVVMTITFRMATTSKTVHSTPTRHTAYFSRTDREPSAHLLEAALHKADFSQALTASEKAALHLPMRMPSGITLIPDHSLMVENINVVEDPNLTWDQCLTPNGNQTGPWTFNTLMSNIRNGTTQQAEQMLTDVIANFAQNVTVGDFTVFARPSGRDFFSNWPRDPLNLCTNPLDQEGALIQCLSLSNAPVHLNAIVNRIDIGQNGGSDQAGQLRFVFGLEMLPNGETNCGGGSGGLNFNIILEYNVPSSISAQSWASQWANLSTLCPLPDGITQSCAQNTFDPALTAITNQVTAAGAGGSGTPNGSALFDLRTNEEELNSLGGNGIQPGTWELRQFLLGQGSTPNILVETPVPQTPDLSFNGGVVPGSGGLMFCSNSGHGCSPLLSEVHLLVQANQTAIVNGTFNLATAAPAVQGGSALNGPFGEGTGDFLVFWDSSPSMSGDTSLFQPRIIFAASPRVANSQTPGADPVGGTDGTCNGCHGAETQTGFQQVVNRTSGNTGGDTASPLSAFLVGCNNAGVPLTGVCSSPFPLNSAGTETEVVQDAVFGSGFNNTFGEIERRLNCMNKILNNPGAVPCNGAGN
jgi:hypothetical protein